MPRRAILVFADQLRHDLERRGLPLAANRLFRLPAIASEAPGGADVHVFARGQSRELAGAQLHAQSGKTFAARFEHAIEAVAALGYDEIVAIGRDCPTLSGSDMALAFEQLADKQLALGPDRRGGCYLIAFHARNRRLLHGVTWNRNTDLEQLRARCPAAAVFLLPIKQDLDSWADVSILARSSEQMAKFAAFIVGMVLAVGRETVYFVDLSAQFVRERGQLPPPTSA